MATRARREEGTALIVTVMLLVLMGVIGLAAMDTVMRDQQVAGYQNKSRMALYAAEAGVADAKDRLRDVFTTIGGAVAFPAQGAPVTLGDPAMFPYGQPRYFGDPAAGGTPIEYMDSAARDLAGGNSLAEGGEQWFNTLWRIRVTGQSLDGATARLDVVATKQLSGGNAY